MTRYLFVEMVMFGWLFNFMTLQPAGAGTLDNRPGCEKMLSSETESGNLVKDSERTEYELIVDPPVTYFGLQIFDFRFEARTTPQEGK